MRASCSICERVLVEGESAWASDWKVLETSGETVTFRSETRYTCDDCEVQR